MNMFPNPSLSVRGRGKRGSQFEGEEESMPEKKRGKRVCFILFFAAFKLFGAVFYVKRRVLYG
jgi:hypothetical protein